MMCEQSPAIDEQPATLEEFRSLYEAAVAFQREAPWEWMTEADIFGIRDPETGRVGYASIMGQLGEHLALAVYLGSEGLNGFWKLESGEGDKRPDLFMEVPQLQASFEDREELHDRDRAVIKALGLKFRGRQAWPMFRSYVPGYVPWDVTGQEVRFLTLALEQALEVSRRFRQDPLILDPPQPEQYLVRHLTDRGWEDEWAVPAPLLVRLPPQLQAQAVAGLRNSLRIGEGKLQVHFFIATQIREKDDPRPYFAYLLLIVEPSSEIVVGTEILVPKPTLEDMWAQVPVHFVDVLTRFGSLPAEIVVRDKQLQFFLEPVAKQLGMRVRIARRLPALDRAKRFLEERM